MKDYIEKEIKVKLDNPLGVIDTLRRNGALFLGGALEKTIRFDTENLDYEKNGKFIRCRSGFSNTITLKEKICSVVASKAATLYNIGLVNAILYPHSYPII